jgi:hypothetical protein
MSSAVFIDIDPAIIERIKVDPDVVACVGEYDRINHIASSSEAAPGQSFIDENGVEHCNHCNSHPRKKARFECDCGAIK